MFIYENNDCSSEVIALCCSVPQFWTRAKVNRARTMANVSSRQMAGTSAYVNLLGEIEIVKIVSNTDSEWSNLLH